MPEYWIADPESRSLEVRIESDGCYGAPVVMSSGEYASVTQPGLRVEIEPLFIWP